MRTAPIVAPVSETQPSPVSMASAPPRPVPAEGPRLARFEDVIALAEARRDIGLKTALERSVHVVRFEEGHIEFRLAEGGRPSIANDLAKALDAWTGRRWIVALSKETGAPTIEARVRTALETRHQDAAAHPLVREVLSRFPGAQIVDVRDKAAPLGAPATGDVDTETEGDEP